MVGSCPSIASDGRIRAQGKNQIPRSLKPFPISPKRPRSPRKISGRSDSCRVIHDRTLSRIGILRQGTDLGTFGLTPDLPCAALGGPPLGGQCDPRSDRDKDSAARP